MADGRLKAYAAAAAVFGLDRLTKIAIERGLAEGAFHRVIPGFFDIVRSANSGVAFGIFNDSSVAWRTLALVLVNLVAVIAISVYLWRGREIDRPTLWGLGLILGGAAGNGLDRIVSGRVTDFLDFYLGEYHWPAFNVADSSIVIGGGLLILGMLRTKPRAAHVS